MATCGALRPPPVVRPAGNATTHRVAASSYPHDSGWNRRRLRPLDPPPAGQPAVDGPRDTAKRTDLVDAADEFYDDRHAECVSAAADAGALGLQESDVTIFARRSTRVRPQEARARAARRSLSD